MARWASNCGATSAAADYSLGPKTVTRISIFYIFFYGLDFLIFSAGPSPIDRMLAATVHLVLFTAVMKIFSARTYRDYGYLATLSFLMMLASAVLTVGTTFLVFFAPLRALRHLHVHQL